MEAGRHSIPAQPALDGQIVAPYGKKQPGLRGNFHRREGVPFTMPFTRKIPQFRLDLHEVFPGLLRGFR